MGARPINPTVSLKLDSSVGERQRVGTGAAKRSTKAENATVLIWKMSLVVELNFRKLNALHLLTKVCAGIEYQDSMRASARTVKATRGKLAA